MIVFEGLDASGKSTLISAFEKELRRRGLDPLVTREPGGTPLAEEIRQLLISKSADAPAPRTEVLLYEASRAQHVEQVIRPALAQGRWVLCDRFTGSTVAFQVYGRGESAAEIEWLNNYATRGLEPDLTVLLDLSVEDSRKRLQKRQTETRQEADRFESEQIEFHERVRKGYVEQSARAKNWLRLDANRASDDLTRELISVLVEKNWLES